MDSSKLLNIKLLAGVVANANPNLAFVDISNALITGPCTLFSCNIDKSSITPSVLGLISITSCKGLVNICIEAEEANSPMIIQSSDLSGSVFLLSEEPSRPFVGAGENTFNGAVFKKLIANNITVTMDLCGTSNTVSGNSFKNCTFEGVRVKFSSDAIETLAIDNIFDFSTFNGGGVLFELDTAEFNSNTFRSCSFNGSTISILDTVDAGSFDFTGSKFSECALDIFKNQLIENCQFFNCSGSDGDTEALLSNAKKLDRAYGFTYNNVAYTVPAAA